MSVATFTKTGTKASTPAKLAKDIFALEIDSHELVRSAYEMHLANGRVNLATTKTRGEVRGGGRKPWRQKGTGRARFGSSRVPIWRGGGITFGPLGEENYSKSMNKKAKKLAIRQALTLKADNIMIIEDFVTKGKTSEAKALLSKIGADKRSLIVLSEISDEVARSTDNMPDVSLIRANYLNVYELINADHVVMTKSALEVVNEWLGGSK